MAQVIVKIKNQLGLHARPAAEFVKIAAKYKSTIFLSKNTRNSKNTRKVNGKSIMGVMTLAAAKGSELIIEARGEDEQSALEALVKLVEVDKFYED